MVVIQQTKEIITLSYKTFFILYMLTTSLVNSFLGILFISVYQFNWYMCVPNEHIRTSLPRKAKYQKKFNYCSSLNQRKAQGLTTTLGSVQTPT